MNESKSARSIYRKVDWGNLNAVNYRGMKEDVKEDLDWTKVDLRKAEKNSSFSIDAVDWDEVNESKSAKSLYRKINWGKVDFTDTELVSAVKEDLDWTQVEFKEAKRSNKFRVDVVDWDEINASENAKSIYRNLESKHLDDANGETLLKMERSGFLGKKLKENIRSKVNDSIVAGSDEEPVFDLSDLDFDQVKLDLSFLNESDKDLEFGIYVIENIDGAVKDPITGDLITPGSEGYAEAALNSNNIYDDLSTINEDGTKLKNASARYEEEEGKDMFATYLTDNLTGETYFAFDEANAEGNKFFKSFGDGTIGIKDDKNNQDFDDLLLGLDINFL